MAIDEIRLLDPSVASPVTLIRLLETSARAAERLISAGFARRYRGGEVVFHQGDEGSSVHIVLSGRFAMDVESPAGTAVTLALFAPGDSFGDITHLSREPFRLATVLALEPAEALMIPGRRFDEIRSELPEIDRALCAMQVERLRAAHQRIVELAEVSAPRRVISALARLTGVYRSGPGPVTISLSQRRLAGMAGTSRDTVNRVLARAEREGWLLVGRQKIVVLNDEELQRRAP